MRGAGAGGIEEIRMTCTTRRHFIGALSGAGLVWLGAAAPVRGESEPAALVRPADIGSTSRLEILPLVDWVTASPELRGEAGVSYLVRSDSSTILFDVGGNLEGTDPSPLEANMQRLGVRLADIDTIVISHLHMDHVGGQSFARQGSFSLGRQQVDLGGKRVVVPTAMRYSGVEPLVAHAPMRLAPGVLTTGTITGALPIGPVDEQALAVRVQGRGVVLVVGCGHQGLERLLERAARLFDEPLYGIVGGLHYPVPRGRLFAGGVDVQRWATYGTAAGPSPEDVQRAIDRLAARQPQWVSLSPHDSSDEMIELFRKTFGARYHELRVGEPQLIAGAP